MDIGFTGTQNGITIYQSARLGYELSQFEPELSSASHGLCIGADGQFHDIVKILVPGIWIVGHPGLEKGHPKRVDRDCDEYREIPSGQKPTIERNHHIVDECHFLFACSGDMEEVLRSGTWATIRYASKQGRDGIIIFPDGSIRQLENFKYR